MDNGQTKLRKVSSKMTVWTTVRPSNERIRQHGWDNGHNNNIHTFSIALFPAGHGRQGKVSGRMAARTTAIASKGKY